MVLVVSILTSSAVIKPITPHNTSTTRHSVKIPILLSGIVCAGKIERDKS